MAELEVYVDLSKNFAKRYDAIFGDNGLIKDKDYMKGGWGISFKSIGEAWVIIDNIAILAFKFTNRHDGGYKSPACINCGHFKDGTCELKFDLFEEALLTTIVGITVHEMLHVLGCDDDQIQWAGIMAEDSQNFTPLAGCPKYWFEKNPFLRRNAKKGDRDG